MFSGCEAKPADEEIVISPSTATISLGQSITFTASGGYDYRWELKHEDWGYLSTRSGPTTTYTAAVRPPVSSGPTTSSGDATPTGQKQVLTCISVIPDDPDIYDGFDSEDHATSSGSGGTSTNSSTSYQVLGTAYITFID